MAIIGSLLAGRAEIALDAGIKKIFFSTIGSTVEKGGQTLMHDAETQIPTVKNLISQGTQTVRNVIMQTGLNEAGIVNALSNEGQKVTANPSATRRWVTCCNRYGTNFQLWQTTEHWLTHDICQCSKSRLCNPAIPYDKANGFYWRQHGLL